MERYSKTSSSKWQNRYSEEFKRFVCNEFLTGTATRRYIEQKYRIGNSRITYWLREFGYNDSKSTFVPLPTMSQSKSQSNIKKSNSDLLKELEEAKLLAETYKKMIELTEKELKIKIVKKSNTK
ncbi:conserved protein of unknown function [Tenacibaculum sp. 190524A02b]|uniref:hypothetical protein n=1 Tax=Tenacibaculum vairaonense TaxID=3137860 RepID=UPI0032B1421A